ncbi:hypothetical protein [Streptomyces sp. SPB4]|uniref:hypothetical protein n=1 Tax=Streptomyces TaxID=1883 RepID=UPI002475C964|nr:hypothetical protein [Streptomyces sp. SPB4]MDH6543743.1 hypothetical protein [Streptomyces sp. SPB4]
MTAASIEVARDIANEMRKGYAELFNFAITDPFQQLLKELYSLPAEDRPLFVAEVVLNPDERAKRGVNVPDGILVLRSAFGDRRPTLFCLKKYLPERFRNYWQNVNLTFDNGVEDQDEEGAWRLPLSASAQAALITLEAVAADGAPGRPTPP